MHLQDALGQFQVQLRADGRSEHTRNQYQRHIVAHDRLGSPGSRSPHDHRRDHAAVVAEFFARTLPAQRARRQEDGNLGNAQRTSLRCFFRWAHESGLTPNNVARLLKRARCTPPPPKAIHADEQHRLLDALAAATGPESARDQMLIELMLRTGLRLGSAIGLDIEDLDLTHNEAAVRTAKNSRPCTVVLPSTIANKLREFLDGRVTGPLFRAGDRRISQRHVQRRLARWFATAKIVGGSAHSLRHTYATDLLARTGDLRLVQAAMNHASIASTTIYAQVDRAKLRAAIGG
jgi:site-specific recombinase XerC